MSEPNKYINSKGFRWWFWELYDEIVNEYDSCKEDRVEAMACYWRGYKNALDRILKEVEERELTEQKTLEELLTEEEVAAIKEKRGGNIFDDWY